MINASVAAVSYALYGWNWIGAHVAARWTARFSVLVFIVAFAQPGLQRWIASLPSYVRLMHTFLAAHCVHFATVALVFALDAGFDLRRKPAVGAAVVLIGGGTVLISGLTASRRKSGVFRFIHPIASYGVFILFMLVFVNHRILVLRGIAVLLVVALLLRIKSIVITKREVATSASA